MSELVATPGQTVGPFFHIGLPFDGDSTLVPPGSLGALRLHGVVYDGAGQPVPDALIEIRQPDASGAIPSLAGSLTRDGQTFTGWGRCATDASGRYGFTTVAPGPDGDVSFFAVTVFARGLLNRLFTRAYLPAEESQLLADPFLGSLSPADRGRLVATREQDGDLRFNIYLQGEQESIFLLYPRHQE